MKPKYWILLTCILCGIGFGITAAALKDMGSYHNLAEAFTGFAVVMIMPIMFLGIPIMAEYFLGET